MRVGAALLFLVVSVGARGNVQDKAHEGKERLAREAQELKEKAKAQVKDRIDEVFVTCDPYKADTRKNRLRFAEYFDTLDVPDAKNIYCFVDYMGIDYTAMFSFTCDSASVGRIVRSKGLAKSADEFSKPGLRGSWEFPWWKEEELDHITPWHRGKDQDDRIYLWYDPVLGRVTYQQFSL